MKNNRRKLMMVEDDPGVYEQLEWYFDEYEVIVTASRTQAVAELRRHEPPVVTLDLGLPPDADGVSEGFNTLQELLSLAPQTKIIVVTAHGDQENAVRAVGMGAYDFYSKPVDVDVLSLIVARAFRIYELEEENRRLLRRQAPRVLDGVIGTSSAMLDVCKLVEKIGPTNVTTLLLGESGTGKELLARAIHNLSPRAGKPFIAINCAAIPEALLESELFGHEKGAFTGANKQVQGKIEHADGGTLFLDEIGDMPVGLQAKMLRFLQERVIERVGGRKEIPVDVRVVCATNQELSNLIESGDFRQDLYYRISEIEIKIPPLRERGGDAVLLARALLDKYSQQYNRSVARFSHDATEAIQAYSWPGNVRELDNKIKGAVLLSEGNQVTASDLGLLVNSDADEPLRSLNLRHLREDIERRALQQALVITNRNISKAADLLGVTRPTFYNLLHKYQLDVPED